MSRLNSLRSFVETESVGAEQAVKENLELLVQLSDAKADFFKIKTVNNLRVSVTDESAEVPIKSILETYSRVFAVTKTEGDTIKNTLERLIENISPGSVLGGRETINALVANIVSGFLEHPAASRDDGEYYIVYAEHNALIRLDIHLWSQKADSSALAINELNSLLVMTCSKSVIDVQKLKLNTLAVLYQRQLSSINARVDDNKIADIIRMYDVLHEA